MEATVRRFFTILFTLVEDAGGGGVSGLGSISSSGTRSGLSEKMLSRSISLPFVSPFSIHSTVTLSLSSFKDVTIA